MRQQRHKGWQLRWLMIDVEWWMMNDEWWMMNDKWWMMDDGWWMMDDGWWMMNDEWWMMNDEWWMMDDGWWMMNNNDGWLMIDDDVWSSCHNMMMDKLNRHKRHNRLYRCFMNDVRSCFLFSGVLKISMVTRVYWIVEGKYVVRYEHQTQI